MAGDLKIINWNCHSLYTKLSHFKVKLYSERPHIVCLCETWLREPKLPNFVNYKSYFCCRKNRAGGGLAMLVRNDVCVNELKLRRFVDGGLEVQAVTVFGEGNRVDVLNLYNPSKEIRTLEYEYYFEQMGDNKVIVGDFNAHHQLWNTETNENKSGENLAEALMNNPDLCLLTPVNLRTYYHIPTRKYSTLDLCLVSTGLYTRLSVELGGTGEVTILLLS